MVVSGPRSALGFALAMFLSPTHLDERATSVCTFRSVPECAVPGVSPPSGVVVSGVFCQHKRSLASTVRDVAWSPSCWVVLIWTNLVKSMALASPGRDLLDVSPLEDWAVTLGTCISQL